MVEMMRRADGAALYRHALPAELGGSDGTNLNMARIREHLANKPLGLHGDLQTESSCVGNFPIVLVDARLDDVERELRAAVADKLAVARPGYAGPRALD